MVFGHLLLFLSRFLQKKIRWVSMLQSWKQPKWFLYRSLSQSTNLCSTFPAFATASNHLAGQKEQGFMWILHVSCLCWAESVLSDGLMAKSPASASLPDKNHAFPRLPLQPFFCETIYKLFQISDKRHNNGSHKKVIMEIKVGPFGLEPITIEFKNLNEFCCMISEKKMIHFWHKSIGTKISQVTTKWLLSFTDKNFSGNPSENLFYWVNWWMMSGKGKKNLYFEIWKKKDKWDVALQLFSYFDEIYTLYYFWNKERWDRCM